METIARQLKAVPMAPVSYVTRILGISRNKGYHLVQRGHWPSLDIHGTIRINTAELCKQLGLDPTPPDAPRPSDQQHAT